MSPGPSGGKPPAPPGRDGVPPTAQRGLVSTGPSGGKPLAPPGRDRVPPTASREVSLSTGPSGGKPPAPPGRDRVLVRGAQRDLVVTLRLAVSPEGLASPRPVLRGRGGTGDRVEGAAALRRRVGRASRSRGCARDKTSKGERPWTCRALRTLEQQLPDPGHGSHRARPQAEGPAKSLDA